MVRLVGYFTIQANVLVAITAFTQLRRPDRDGWRVLRVAAVVGITITGIAHWFFLPPLLALVWPVAWLAYTLVRGAVTWALPVPVPERRGAGAASVVVTSLGITVLFVVISPLLWLADRRLPVRSPR